MKNILNRKFFALLALVATFVLPVVAFAADDEPAAAAVAGDSSGWIILSIMILIFFIGCIALLAMGSGLAAAMIGYKLGKEDE